MSLRKSSSTKGKAKGFRSPEHWPSTEEIDGFRYELGPDPQDSRWVAENMNGEDYDSDEQTPDHILDRQADEAMELDRLERGLRFF